MESAGIAELKARLSEYLLRVKAREEVLVTDRGRPVARLVPAGTDVGSSSRGEAEQRRLRAMEREGFIRLGSGGLPDEFFEKRRPEDREALERGRAGGARRRALEGEVLGHVGGHTAHLS